MRGPRSMMRPDDPSGKMRKHRRMRLPPWSMWGGLVAAAGIVIITGIILGIRATGIMDRRVVFGADSSSIPVDFEVATAAAARDSKLLADGMPLEYNGPLCSVPLTAASASRGAAASYADAAAARGGLTPIQTWGDLVPPHHGDPSAADAVAGWSRRSAAAVRRTVEALVDAEVMPATLGEPSSLGGRSSTALLASCGLGHVASAAAGNHWLANSEVLCTEASSARHAVAEAQLQQLLSGPRLRRVRAVLAPGPAVAPRLGLADGSVQLVLAPVESMFLEVSALLAGRARRRCARARPPFPPPRASRRAALPSLPPQRRSVSAAATDCAAPRPCCWFRSRAQERHTGHTRRAGCLHLGVPLCSRRRMRRRCWAWGTTTAPGTTMLRKAQGRPRPRGALRQTAIWRRPTRVQDRGMFAFAESTPRKCSGWCSRRGASSSADSPLQSCCRPTRTQPR